MAKGQTSIEFVILVGAVLFFVVTFLFYLQTNVQENDQERVAFLLRDTALTVQEEINLASKSAEGYSRTFTLPQDIVGHNYTIQIVSGLAYIRTSDGKNALSFPVSNITGDVQKGNNVIQKSNGMVYLNTNP